MPKSRCAARDGRGNRRSQAKTPQAGDESIGPSFVGMPRRAVVGRYALSGVDQGTCPNGHAVDLAGGRFCEICGLAATCPNGHPVTTPDAAFCDQCQLPIGAAPAPPGGGGFSRQVVLLAGLGLGLIVAVVVVILVLASGGSRYCGPGGSRSTGCGRKRDSGGQPYPRGLPDHRGASDRNPSGAGLVSRYRRAARSTRRDVGWLGADDSRVRPRRD